jgi:hypothetical protein
MEGFSFLGVAVGPDEREGKNRGNLVTIARAMVATRTSQMDIAAIIA